MTLTLGSSVAMTDRVTVSYTKPGSGSNNKLKDSSNNNVASFTDENVTNNTPPPCPVGQPADAFWEACLTVGKNVDSTLYGFGQFHTVPYPLQPLAEGVRTMKSTHLLRLSYPGLHSIFPSLPIPSPHPSPGFFRSEAARFGSTPKMRSPHPAIHISGVTPASPGTTPTSATASQSAYASPPWASPSPPQTV